MAPEISTTSAPNLLLDPSSGPYPDGSPELLLSVIVPARNEEDSIGDCLRSLVAQSEADFELGRNWELFVVDDHSTDATRDLASSFANVTLLEAPALPDGWTGKANAVWFAAQRARGHWLLFTDADTVHKPGDLRRAIHEAERHHVAMLSYSPRQLVHGFWQHALMPLIFADLAVTYPPNRVNQAESRVAAANGQFLMIERAAYQRIGGHAAVHSSILEDVELARRCKQHREGLRFRYAPDAVSTRMYRSFRAMCEGWTKNLALLFPNPLLRAFWNLINALLIFGLPILAIYMHLTVVREGAVAAVVLWWIWRVGVHYSRTSKSNFPLRDTLFSPLALPLFAWLLWRSWAHKTLRRQVTWKGRTYAA